MNSLKQRWPKTINWMLLTDGGSWWRHDIETLSALPLWTESTAYRWFPSKGASYAEFRCFFWYRPEPIVDQKVELPEIWDATLTWCHSWFHFSVQFSQFFFQNNQCNSSLLDAIFIFGGSHSRLAAVSSIIHKCEALKQLWSTFDGNFNAPENIFYMCSMVLKWQN